MHNDDLEKIYNASPFTIICTQLMAIDIKNIYPHPIETIILIRDNVKDIKFEDNNLKYVILEKTQNKDEIFENNKKVKNINGSNIDKLSKYEKIFYKKILENIKNN